MPQSSRKVRSVEIDAFLDEDRLREVLLELLRALPSWNVSVVLLLKALELLKRKDGLTWNQTLPVSFLNSTLALSPFT